MTQSKSGAVRSYGGACTSRTIPAPVRYRSRLMALIAAYVTRARLDRQVVGRTVRVSWCGPCEAHHVLVITANWAGLRHCEVQADQAWGIFSDLTPLTPRNQNPVAWVQARVAQLVAEAAAVDILVTEVTISVGQEALSAGTFDALSQGIRNGSGPFAPRIGVLLESDPMIDDTSDRFTIHARGVLGTTDHPVSDLFAYGFAPSTAFTKEQAELRWRLELDGWDPVEAAAASLVL